MLRDSLSFRAVLSAIAMITLSLPAVAQSKRIHYSSGTGFFISSAGHIVTNAHVIQRCSTGKVQLSGAATGEADIIATDADNDLALLQADVSAPRVAQLLGTQSNIAKGDEVMVMGYPLDAAMDGQYRVALAEVVGVRGPTGEAQWLQFSSSAQKGNSGGPLLDTSGNVIGVVTGKTEVTGRDSQGHEVTVSQSDIAVNLEILERFLEDHRIRYQQREAYSTMSAGMIESMAKDFIVSLRCVTGEELVR